MPDFLVRIRQPHAYHEPRLGPLCQIPSLPIKYRPYTLLPKPKGQRNVV